MSVGQEPTEAGGARRRSVVGRFAGYVLARATAQALGHLLLEWIKQMW
ncbi:hypothetical protein ACWGBY_20850 [Streptomyces griseus]